MARTREKGRYGDNYNEGEAGRRARTPERTSATINASPEEHAAASVLLHAARDLEYTKSYGEKHDLNGQLMLVIREERGQTADYIEQKLTLLGTPFTCHEVEESVNPSNERKLFITIPADAYEALAKRFDYDSEDKSKPDGIITRIRDKLNALIVTEPSQPTDLFKVNGMTKGDLATIIDARIYAQRCISTNAKDENKASGRGM